VVVAAAFPASRHLAAGSAGVAQFITGDVNVLRANGKPRRWPKANRLKAASPS
jgi:hypothetical protein